MPSIDDRSEGLTPGRIVRAKHFLRGRIRRTPVEESPGLSERLGVSVFLKLENLQVTGSFKIRGALFRLSLLSEKERGRGAVTASAGNHGKAMAYAGRELGVPVRILVPATVDEAKFRGILSLGADCSKTEFPGYDATEAAARREAADRGLPFVSPFDDWDVMAANGGSLAGEVLEQIPDARTFLLPVGGGGLAAGFSFWVKGTRAGSTLVGCQLEASPALDLSLKSGQAVTELPPIDTLAGGLEGGIGRLTFSVLRSRIDGVALVTEGEVAQAFRWMLAEHQYLLEPSAAAVVAACLSGKVQVDEGPAVVVLSGRNVALETVRRLLS